MKVSFIIFCIVFFATISYAGLTGFSFLKLSSDAKSAALSNMTTALPNYEASSIFLNPADLVFHKENNLLFNSTNFYNDLQFYNLSYSFQRLIYNYGIGIKNLKTVKVERTEIEGQNAIRNLGFAEFYDRQLTFAIGRQINSNSGLGLSLNMFQEKIDDKTKQTFFLNIGYRNYFYKNLVYGVSIRNIGPAIKYYKDKTDLPAMISNGLYFQPEISFLPALCLEFNYERNNDASLITALIFNFEKYINVYLSYSNYSKIQNKLNGGISISYKNFDLCYGYQNIEDFGDLHSFNISLKFATKVREKKEVVKLKPVEKNIEVDETKLYYNLLKTGQENLENKRFDEALFYFEKAIELKEDKNIELYRKIGDIYFQKKDYTKAKEFYDKYLEKIKKEGE